jgi:4-hydroxybenzoate polyprenyltransferase
MTVTAARRQGGIREYLAIARFDHATKHVFVIPGMVLAYILRGVHSDNVMRSILLGFVCVVMIASANYVINEWLDRDFDKHHPTKSQRSAVSTELKGPIVYGLWLIFLAIGLGAAFFANKVMFLVALVFGAQGVFYNVPPLRSKDKAYLDVISESINNPLRLMIGWAMIDPSTLPPSSIIASYWFGGAFLMAAKRLSEYREIVANHGRDLLVRYRRSFAGYDEAKLILSCFLYALLSSFFLAVFLIKYRIEYIISLPAFAVLFVQYLGLSLQPGSVAQKPERLFKEKSLMVTIFMVVLLFTIATFTDISVLNSLTHAQYISLGQ